MDWMSVCDTTCQLQLVLISQYAGLVPLDASDDVSRNITDDVRVFLHLRMAWHAQFLEGFKKATR